MALRADLSLRMSWSLSFVCSLHNCFSLLHAGWLATPQWYPVSSKERTKGKSRSLAISPVYSSQCFRSYHYRHIHAFLWYRNRVAQFGWRLGNNFTMCKKVPSGTKIIKSMEVALAVHFIARRRHWMDLEWRRNLKITKGWGIGTLMDKECVNNTN